MLALLLPMALAMPCDTLPQLRRVAGPLHPPPSDAPAPPGLGERDPYELPNFALSQHFAMRWGDELAVDPGAAEELLAAFENALQVAVVDMGHPAPEGLDAHLFNVYIGNSGADAPYIREGAAGYFTVDGEGWPMIVLQPYLLAGGYGDGLAYGRSVAAHELYHAIQHATGSYEHGIGDSSGWFWEATATWFTDEADPADVYYPMNLAGFAYLPHYPLTFDGNSADNSSESMYPYGAFVFPRYLSEEVADWRIIRDAWTAPLAEEALESLGLALEAQGLDLGAVFAESAARTVHWDYQDGDLYASWVDEYEVYLADEDYRITDRVGDEGTDGWTEPPEDLLPGRYGRNVIRMGDLECGALTVALEGEPEGDEGSPAAWYAVAVLERDEGLEYLWLTRGEPTGELAFDLTGEEDSLTLVVVAASPEDDSNETYPYRYAMTFEPGDPVLCGVEEAEPEPKPAADPGGCGRGGAAALLLLLAGLPRRRRG